MSFSNPTLINTTYHVVRNLFSKHPNGPVKLGRWGINTASKSGLIADYSNEDHCGTCAQYISKKIPEFNKNITKDDLQYEFESMSINVPSIKKSNK